MGGHINCIYKEIYLKYNGKNYEYYGIFFFPKKKRTNFTVSVYKILEKKKINKVKIVNGLMLS